MSELETSLFGIVRYAFLPVITATLGGIMATFRPLSGKARSYVQHFAAGVVFSVVAVELLPNIVQRHLPWEVALGFSLGVIAMMGVKKLTSNLESSARQNPAGLLVGVGIDIFLDGILIGFAAGTSEGILLTIALTVELLSLGLAVAASLGKAGYSRIKSILVTSGLSCLVVFGTLAGALLLKALPSGAIEIVLAFGLAALLYLVTEELLTEAHEEPETPLATASFFAGFLVFLIMGMMGSAQR